MLSEEMRDEFLVLMIHPGISLPEFTGYYFIITIPHSHALQTYEAVEAGREREEVRMTQDSGNDFSPPKSRHLPTSNSLSL
jgi:hypothetical protein